ncbi:MAG: tetratricopeptide repeat protein [Bacteroidales bacterium]|nr:tetratricopeptide repeat protein [Bacteroidales bacterium]MCL2133436.1 tetratricopeptide repeat protein [Bacteroidales bacterium]
MKYITAKKIVLWSSILLLALACSPKTTGSFLDKLMKNKELVKDFYLTEGLKYDILGDKNNANTLLFNALKADPSCDACYYKLAEIYLERGLIPQALHLSSAAVQLDSTNMWYRMQLCGICIIAGDFQKAEEQLNYLEPEMANNPQFLFMQYETYMNSGKVDEGLAVLNKLSILNPNPRIYAFLGEIYSSLQEDSLSLDAFQQSLAMAPDYPPALFGEMDYYRQKQHFDAFFDRWYPICENTDIPMEMKLDYLSALMRMPRFPQLFKEQLDTTFTLLRPTPDSLVEPLYGGYLVQTGRSDSAMAVFRNSVLLFPKNAQVWESLLGFIYYQEDWNNLEISAAEALQIFPNNVPFMTLKALALWRQEEVPKAIQLFEESLPHSKGNQVQTLQTYAMLGDLYQQEGNSKKAFNYYEKVLAVDSSNVVVLNNYAYFLSLTDQQLDKAYRMSQKAITAEPNNATYLDTFGWILYKMGKYFEAKAIFKHALIYGGNEEAVILDHYGDVLDALGEKEAAIVYWEMSYRKEPDPEVRKKYRK